MDPAGGKLYTYRFSLEGLDRVGSGRRRTRVPNWSRAGKGESDELQTEH